MELLGLIFSAMGMAMATSCFLVLSQGAILGGTYSMLLALIPSAIMAILTMFSFSEMASRFPKNQAGLALFFIKGLGKERAVFPILFYLSMIGVIASVEVHLLSKVIHLINPSLPELLLTFLVIVLALMANREGIQISKKIQVLCSLILFSLIVYLSLNSQKSISVSEIKTIPFINQVAMGIFLFFGVEWITPLGRNKKSYTFSIPYSMPLAIVFLSLLYALVLFKSSTVTDGEPLHYTLAFEQFGKNGVYLAVLISFLALFSSFHMGIMGGTKMLYAFGRIKVLPKVFTSIFLHSGRPKGALFVLLGFVLVSNLIIFKFDIFTEVILAGAIIQCLFYALAIETQIRLKSSAKKAIFKSPLATAFLRSMQVMYVGLSLMILVDAKNLLIVLSIFALLAIFISALRLNIFLPRKIQNV